MPKLERHAPAAIPSLKGTEGPKREVDAVDNWIQLYRENRKEFYREIERLPSAERDQIVAALTVEINQDWLRAEGLDAVPVAVGGEVQIEDADTAPLAPLSIADLITVPQMAAATRPRPVLRLLRGEGQGEPTAPLRRPRLRLVTGIVREGA